MTKKYLCPFHEENTPSLVVYPDRGFKCFGCGKAGNVRSLPFEVDLPAQKPLADVDRDIKYIESLPSKEIRGLIFPYDNLGYYIVWPSKKYYLVRNWESAAKYTGPSGHPRPPLVGIGDWKDVLIVEGELNLLSLRHMGFSQYMITPGGTGQFKSSQGKLVYACKRAKNVRILVDNDTAGRLAALTLSGKLKETYPNLEIKIITFDQGEDLNDLLVKYGRDGARQEVKRRLGEV